MEDRETKTLAEASNDELVAEISARSRTLVMGVIFHSEPGTWRRHQGGLVIEGLSLANMLLIEAHKMVAAAPEANR